MPQRTLHHQRDASVPFGAWLRLTPHQLAGAGIALIVAAICVAYGPALHGGFIWDDYLYVANCDLVKAPDGLYRFWFTTDPIDYWPVSNSTFWIEWRLWGTNTTGYHLTNIVLHGASALLVWLILRRLSIPGAFLAALLFAVHPMNVESVAWIAQRKGLMALCFSLLSSLWYLKSQGEKGTVGEERVWNWQRTGWYCASLLGFLLAMLSKGSVAILPVVLLGLTWWPRRQVTRWDLVRAAPFFLVAVVFTGVNIWFQKHGTEVVIRDASLSQRVAGAGAVVWFYLSKALLPINLVFVYPPWHIQTNAVLWWLPLLAALVVTAVLVGQRNSPQANWTRPFLFAWGFFCVALVPVLGFTDVYFMKFSLVADHYQHIALVGVVALVAAAWSGWRFGTEGAARWAAIVTAVAVVGTLTLLTRQQSRLYGDEITLYQSTLEKNPDCWMAHYNLAVELAKAGWSMEAIGHFRQALRLKTDYEEAHNNLGVELAKTGRPQEAIECFERALQLKPNYPEAHNNLGLALVSLGRLSEAIQHYQQALRLKPDYPEAHNNLGNALVSLGRLSEAIQHYQQSLRLEPDDAIAHYNLGIALTRAGQMQKAIEQFRQALELKPDLAQAYQNLATAYAQMQRPAEAIAAAQKGLDLARSHGQTALAQQIEAWLTAFRAGQSKNSSEGAPRSEGTPATP